MRPGARSSSPGSQARGPGGPVASTRTRMRWQTKRMPVLRQRARQEMSFGQDLEAVADTQDGPLERAKSSSGAMTLAKRAMAPGRR